MTDDTLTILSRAMMAGDPIPFDRMPAWVRTETRLRVYQLLVALRDCDSVDLDEALGEARCCARCAWKAGFDALIAEGGVVGEAVH